MDFVDGYGSDSDDGNGAKVTSQPVVAVAIKAPPAVAKKVKRLDITFLPPEIQAALARGDSTKDSDDEDDGIARFSGSFKASAQPITDASSALLGMLPAPKGKDTDALANKPVMKTRPAGIPASVKSAAGEEGPAKTSAPKSAFSFGYTTVEKTKTVASKAGNSSAAASVAAPVANKKQNVEEEEKSTVLPWFQEQPQRPAAFATNPAPTKVLHSSYTTSTASSSSSNGRSGLLGASTYEMDSIEAAAPAAQPRQVSYQEYLQQNQSLQEQQEFPDGPSHKKRKDRNFELQLMSGDLSGLQNAPVQDISVQHQWNELAYTEQQQREQEVQRGFGIGVNKNLMQVTKQQSRKHQLSSLAMKAAETELALLEKRGNRNLTKSETQGKYGW